MKIEKVYRDAYGTTWTYATYERRPRRAARRRRYRRRKQMTNQLLKVATALSVFIIALTVMTSIQSNKAKEVVEYPQESMSLVLNEPLPVGKAEFITNSGPEEVEPPIEPEEEIIIEPTAPVEEIVEEVEPEPIPEPEPTLEECIGQASFTIGETSFTSLDLPDVYYPGVDFSSFQPYEDYSNITNKRSAAYPITRSDRAYNDENGLRRYTLNEDQFSINGKDDYVIALGTFYKPKGTCGQRYLIVTSTGSYTAITGDEKSDLHTDEMHMFTEHGNGTVGIIEWLVDTDTLNSSMRRSGNIATPKGPVEEIKGEILYIYLIDE